MNTVPEQQDHRVPLGMKIGYGVGNFGGQFIYSTIGIFFMYFFTDVAMVSATMAGIILMVSRAWDAVTDPVMGYVSDHSSSRWGQKRPFILFGAVPLGLTFFLIFLVPDFSEMGKFAYYLVMMILMWTMYTIVLVPYNALLANMTFDMEERARVSGYYQIFTVVALIIIGALTKPLTQMFGDERIGFRNTGIIFAIIVIVTFLITFVTVRERFQTGSEDRYQFKNILKLLFMNRPYVILAVTCFFGFVVYTMVGSMLNYFFKYNIKNEALISVALGSIFAVAALAVPLMVYLSNKIGKKQVFTLGMFLYGLTFFLLFFVHEQKMGLIIPLFVLSGIGFAAMNLSMWSMLPDTVEYAQWKLGARTEGVQYGFFMFITKLGASVAGIVIGLGLDMSGYIANVEQTDGALFGIRIFTTLVPTALMVLGIILIQFYPINRELHQKMCREIEERRVTTACD